MSHPLHVLLIEDNPGDARLVMEELQSITSKAQICLRWVTHLRQALEYLEANPVQAILVDLSLPDSHGLETLKSVVNYAPQMPVVVMTGLADEETVMKALQAGAQDYLIKGQVDGRILIRVIQYAIQRKRVEQQLADAREFTERIVSSSPVGIFTYKLSGECLSVNAAAAQMVGGTIEQLKSQNFHQIESWRQSGLYALAIQALNTENPIVGDVHVTTTFGRDAWYTAQFVKFRSAGEELLLLIFSDITERKLAEKVLQEREALLDKTQAISHIGSWELDLVNNRMTWSDEVHRIFGVGVLEFKGTYEAFLNVIHPDDRSMVDDTYSASLRKGLYTYDVEFRIIRPTNGEIRFVHAKANHIHDEAGKIIRSVGMVQDITERRQSEAALAASERRFRAWIEESSDIVTVLDINGIIQYESPSVTRLLGYEPLELIGENAVNFVHPEDQDKVIAAFVKNLHDPDTATSAEFRFRHKDGSWRFLEGTGRAYEDEHGDVVGLVHSRDISERKRVETEVAALQRRFQALIENAPDGIALLNLNGKLSQVTPSSGQILGYTVDESLSQDPALLTHPDDLPALLSLLADLMQNPSKVVRTEYRFRHQDGSWRWLESTISNLLAEPSVGAIVFNYRDTTERKKAEEALANSERRFRALIENGLDYISLLDVEGKLLWESPSNVRMLDYEPNEFIGRNIFELVHVEDRKRVQNQFAELFRQPGSQIRSEFRIQNSKGIWLWLEAIATNLLHVVSVAAIVVNYRDITGRKQAEKYIRHQASILEHVSDAIVASDMDSRMTSWNPAAEEIYGWRAEEVIGRPVNDVLQTQFNEHSTRDQVFQQFVADGLWRGEVTQKRKDGKEITILSSVSLVRDEAGAPAAMVAINRDITARKRAEEGLQALNAELEQRVLERTAELNRSNRELERANRTKDEFLANMSHELRTPLNSILGLTETLLEQRRGLLNEHQEKSLHLIQSSGRHLLDLINDILDLSKIEAGKFDFYPETVGINEITQASLAFVKNLALKKSIKLSYQIDPIVSKIYVDARRVKQILVNLLTNAVKFTPEQGQVSLQVLARADEHLIQFAVIDNGIGIAQKDLVRLFQPFEQVDSQLNRQFEGTGLGLALVKKLTDLHGGSVQVESEVGRGSCFTINLPWRKESGVQQKQAELIESLSERAPSQLSFTASEQIVDRGCILLAEDNMSNILTIGEYLETHGYHVIVAHDGVEALEKAQENNPDLVLMDIQMPGMDGLETTRRLRMDARFANTPIIALTALAMPGDRERCLQAGANEYMTKPVSLKRLRTTIQEQL
jgi:PAS domain S-box-containing protein